MKLSSQLPVSLMFFKHWDLSDREVGVALAKAVFRRRRDGSFRALPAPDIVLEDSFAGDDPAWSPLAQEQEIAPGKEGTDLVIHAVARAPEGRARTDWPVAVEVPDRLHYGFHVRGPAVWTHRRLTGWQRQEPELVSEVPLTYALAYGGQAPGPDDSVMMHAANPAGIGFVTPELLARHEDIPIPQIGNLAEFMVDDPSTQMTLHGTGPIAKTWQPRLGHAGTFDETWERERHPRMPKDYSLRFWNVAQGPLRLDPPLSGAEEVRVTGISTAPEPVCVQLPRVACILAAQGPEAQDSLPMVLDTVTLDLADPDPLTHTATLLWRVQVPGPDRFVQGEVLSTQIPADTTPPLQEA